MGDSRLEEMSSETNVIILPGNGCGNVHSSNWYKWLHDRIIAEGFPVRVVLPRYMPDPNVARETVWIPYIKETLGANEHSIVIGHSSGAEAIMRLLGGGIPGNENGTKVKGAVLVAACYTDLDNDNERASGYYSREWNWETIRNHADWIVQYHSTDDPFIPIDEARHVAQNLRTEYHEFEDHSHFFEPFEHIVDVLREKLTGEKED
eukprot:c46322_g1_i1.p1 GENE.c46322_g1_i1~~c46322_g1_i1.p1  ORF type:complete len:206 (+),score=39.09 c46322_g1_i1:3-620(+)